ncbi:MAG: Smr protein/MutS2 [Verrucomicrobia bacterium]|nr:Smr protein/MutS2 [Verrucomicrobiota bacterium]
MKPEASTDQPLRLPITGELDLHTFDPRDLNELIPAYLAECAARHLAQVRIIHGKGTGRMRVRVHELLRTSPWVSGYRLGNEFTGSWGATVVTLRPEQRTEASGPAAGRKLR